ncbi:Low-density lipoprotein receptor-related protein 2 [Chionoecetes opilio]|uniref:Low-density lipoprotein receptor-related protein 2 n=1 Tax=Chionoecetes opilio TaxID=41210 RepID=A0A8J4YV43_CHIOP|nr:Low-density lipoprotein receptor-related protein 2 [Chionoecetes opilio]
MCFFPVYIEKVEWISQLTHPLPFSDNDADETEPVEPAAAATAFTAEADVSPSDETASSAVLECSGGLLVPLTWRCDGRKDCPLDGLDEMGCAYCRAGEFICPHSGVCVPRGQVCDGSVSIPSCTDELYCDLCPPAHFACDVCVAR